MESILDNFHKTDAKMVKELCSTLMADLMKVISIMT